MNIQGLPLTRFSQLQPSDYGAVGFSAPPVYWTGNATSIASGTAYGHLIRSVGAFNRVQCRVTTAGAGLTTAQLAVLDLQGNMITATDQNSNAASFQSIGDPTIVLPGLVNAPLCYLVYLFAGTTVPALRRIGQDAAQANLGVVAPNLIAWSFGSALATIPSPVNLGGASGSVSALIASILRRA